jgi:hypothetical protein
MLPRSARETDTGFNPVSRVPYYLRHRIPPEVFPVTHVFFGSGQVAGVVTGVFRAVWPVF